MEPFAAVVRVLDVQREGHYAKPFDHERLDYSFLPDQEQLKGYVFNAQTATQLQKSPKLERLLP